MRSAARSAPDVGALAGSPQAAATATQPKALQIRVELWTLCFDVGVSPAAPEVARCAVSAPGGTCEHLEGFQVY